MVLSPTKITTNLESCIKIKATLRWVGVQGLPDGEAPPSGKSSEYIQMRSKGVGHHVWHQHLAIVHLQPITILARHADGWPVPSDLFRMAKMMTLVISFLCVTAGC